MTGRFLRRISLGWWALRLVSWAAVGGALLITASTSWAFAWDQIAPQYRADRHHGSAIWVAAVDATLGSVRAQAAFVVGAAAVTLLVWPVARRVVRGPRPDLLTVVMAEEPAAGGSGDDVHHLDREGILAALREAIDKVKLSAPSTLPGESTSQSLLADLGTQARTGATNPYSLVTLVVSGLLTTRAQHWVRVVAGRSSSGQPILTLEIAHREAGTGRVVRAYGEDWAETIARAAAHIAAAILPRTRLVRSAPWLPWRGREIDGELFYNFQEGRRLAQKQRFEEALTHFDQALKADPLNPYIRMERAAVMDQLGLYIDALATYADIVHIESNYDQRYRKSLRRFFNGSRQADAVTRRTPSPNGPDALLLARFRMVASLASSSRLAEQWVRRSVPYQPFGDGVSPDGSRRQDDARSVVEKLNPLAAAYAHSLAGQYRTRLTGRQQFVELRRRVMRRVGWKPRSRQLPEHLLPAPKARFLTDPGLRLDASYHILRRTLQYAAMYESTSLARDYQLRRGRRWGRRLAVSSGSLRLLPTWSTLQYRYVEAVQRDTGLASRQTEKDVGLEHWQGRPRTTADRDQGDLRLLRALPPLMTHQSARYERRLRYGGLDPRRWWLWAAWTVRRPLRSAEVSTVWPPPMRGVHRQVRRALHLRLHGRLGWLDHYTAACIYAVAMLTPELRREVTQDSAARHVNFIQHAIGRLERSVLAGGSPLADDASPWLHMGDENFNDLRYTVRYRTFVTRFFPAAADATRLPVNAAILAMSRHTLALAHDYAAARHRRLDRLRVAEKPLDVREIASEFTAFGLLERYAADYRSWQVRAELISSGRRLDPRFDPSMRGLDFVGDPMLSRLILFADSMFAERLHKDVSRAPAHAERERLRTVAWLKRSSILQVVGTNSFVRHRNRTLGGLEAALNAEAPLSRAIAAVLHGPALDDAHSEQLVRALTAAWRAIEDFTARNLVTPELPGREPDVEAQPPADWSALDALRVLLAELARERPAATNS